MKSLLLVIIILQILYLTSIILTFLLRLSSSIMLILDLELEKNCHKNNFLAAR